LGLGSAVSSPSEVQALQGVWCVLTQKKTTTITVTLRASTKVNQPSILRGKVRSKNTDWPYTRESGGGQLLIWPRGSAEYGKVVEYQLYIWVCLVLRAEENGCIAEESCFGHSSVANAKSFIKVNIDNNDKKSLLLGRNCHQSWSTWEGCGI